MVVFSSRSLAGDVGRFAVFEQSFTQQGQDANPYVEVSATATFIQPSGRERSIPLFWDGGRQWKVRFSPDVIGAWRWSVRSSDPGLNGAKGSFNCVPSTNHGGILTMAGYPYHFQYQDGTPYWLFGETQWEAFADDPGQGLNARSMSQYFTIRAAQGFNYVHTEIIGLVRSSNLDPSGRENPAFHDYRAQTINPSYFNEVDSTENTRSTELVLDGFPKATYRIRLFDPRTAKRTTVNPSVKNATTFTLLSPDTEDWAFEVLKN